MPLSVSAGSILSQDDCGKVMLSTVQGSSGELREIAAEGLGELVEVTSQEALRPFTVQITGEECTPTKRTPISRRWYRIHAPRKKAFCE